MRIDKETQKTNEVINQERKILLDSSIFCNKKSFMLISLSKNININAYKKRQAISVMATQSLLSGILTNLFFCKNKTNTIYQTSRCDIFFIKTTFGCETTENTIFAPLFPHEETGNYPNI